MADAYVAIEGDRVIEARARAPGTARGELVFTTAYTGYEESLTDPSYEEQVLTFSYPLIGNYGVREERFESDRVHPRAAVAREMTDDVAEWLESEGVPAVDHLDTRDIVTEIRDEGAMKCGIAAGPDVTEQDALDELHECKHMSDHTDIGAQVSVDDVEVHNEGGDGATVALVDCGAKLHRRVARRTRRRGLRLPIRRQRGRRGRGRPGSAVHLERPRRPRELRAGRGTRRDLRRDVPLAGICLGQQVVANALGGETEKMEFGHRGVNQPVRDLRSNQVVMTTQNHGYTVADPGDKLDVTQVNVNDDTPEGWKTTTWTSSRVSTTPRPTPARTTRSASLMMC